MEKPNLFFLSTWRARFLRINGIDVLAPGTSVTEADPYVEPCNWISLGVASFPGLTDYLGEPKYMQIAVVCIPTRLTYSADAEPEMTYAFRAFVYSYGILSVAGSNERLAPGQMVSIGMSSITVPKSERPKMMLRCAGGDVTMDGSLQERFGYRGDIMVMPCRVIAWHGSETTESSVTFRVCYRGDIWCTPSMLGAAGVPGMYHHILPLVAAEQCANIILRAGGAFNKSSPDFAYLDPLMDLDGRIPEMLPDYTNNLLKPPPGGGEIPGGTRPPAEEIQVTASSTSYGEPWFVFAPERVCAFEDEWGSLLPLEGDCWASGFMYGADGEGGEWLQLDLGAPAAANIFAIGNRRAIHAYSPPLWHIPADIDLCASNDSETWTTLTEVRNRQVSRGLNITEHRFDNSTPYRYYRWIITRVSAMPGQSRFCAAIGYLRLARYTGAFPPDGDGYPDGRLVIIGSETASIGGIVTGSDAGRLDIKGLYKIIGYERVQLGDIVTGRDFASLN